MVHQYYAGTDRRRPALTVERDGEPPVSGLFMAIVTNRSPWTYLGDRPLLPVPNPDFNSGLDLLALQRLRLTTVLNAVGQMLYVRSRPPRGRNLLSVLGTESLTLRSARPIALQADGDRADDVAQRRPQDRVSSGGGSPLTGESVNAQFVPEGKPVVSPSTHGSLGFGPGGKIDMCVASASSLSPFGLPRCKARSVKICFASPTLYQFTAARISISYLLRHVGHARG
jgi:hypothetical protein